MIDKIFFLQYYALDSLKRLVDAGSSKGDFNLRLGDQRERSKFLCGVWSGEFFSVCRFDAVLVLAQKWLIIGWQSNRSAVKKNVAVNASANQKDTCIYKRISSAPSVEHCRNDPIVFGSQRKGTEIFRSIIRASTNSVGSLSIFSTKSRLQKYKRDLRREFYLNERFV